MEFLALNFVRVFEPAVTTTVVKFCAIKLFKNHSFSKNWENIEIFLLSKFQTGGPNCNINVQNSSPIRNGSQKKFSVEPNFLKKKFM